MTTNLTYDEWKAIRKALDLVPKTLSDANAYLEKIKPEETSTEYCAIRYGGTQPDFNGHLLSAIVYKCSDQRLIAFFKKIEEAQSYCDWLNQKEKKS